MSVTDAQRRANKKYFEANYRQVKLSMPNDEVNALESHCMEFGYTKAGFIRQAIKDKIGYDKQSSAYPWGKSP